MIPQRKGEARKAGRWTGRAQGEWETGPAGSSFLSPHAALGPKPDYPLHSFSAFIVVNRTEIISYSSWHHDYSLDQDNVTILFKKIFTIGITLSNCLYMFFHAASLYNWYFIDLTHVPRRKTLLKFERKSIYRMFNCYLVKKKKKFALLIGIELY